MRVILFCYKKFKKKRSHSKNRALDLYCGSYILLLIVNAYNVIRIIQIMEYMNLTAESDNDG